MKYFGTIIVKGWDRRIRSAINLNLKYRVYILENNVRLMFQPPGWKQGPRTFSNGPTDRDKDYDLTLKDFLEQMGDLHKVGKIQKDLPKKQTKKIRREMVARQL